MAFNADSVSSKRQAVVIDQHCSNLQIPFASFVDRGMIRKQRQDAVINTTIGRELDGVKRKFQIKQSNFNSMLGNATLKTNSLVDINSRTENHEEALEVNFEGPQPSIRNIKKKARFDSVPNRYPSSSLNHSQEPAR